MSNLPYHEQKDIENVKHLRELIGELPLFCPEFFRGIEPRTSSRTRIAYAYDLSVFFHFLQEENPYFHSKEIKEIQLDDLDKITVTDIE